VECNGGALLDDLLRLVDPEYLDDGEENNSAVSSAAGSALDTINPFNNSIDANTVWWIANMPRDVSLALLSRDLIELEPQKVHLQ